MRSRHSDPPERIRLTLLPLQGRQWLVPAAVRLRGLLKYALRVCGFRCEGVEEVNADVRRVGAAEGQDAGGIEAGVQCQA